MSFEDFLEAIYAEIQLEDHETEWCRRWFLMGTAPRDAVSAIEDTRRMRDEAEQASLYLAGWGIDHEIDMRRNK